MDRLPERQKLILKEIVDRYIRYREPVSSRMILEDYGLSVSSATVRNDMNDLEEAGYIEKPYSSSGRIPTNRGYRFFVDWLLDLSELTRKERMEVVEAYEMRCLEVGQTMHHTAFLLGNITGYAGFVIPPRWGDTKLDRIILVRTGPHVVMFVIVSDIGVVEHGLIQLQHDLTEDEIQKVTDAINSNLCGVPLEKVRQLTAADGPEGWYNQLSQEALLVLRRLLERRMRQALYVEGMTSLAGQLQQVGEGDGLEQFVALTRALEDDKEFGRAVADSRGGGERLSVSVGNCPLPGLERFSVVTCGYRPYSGVVGVVGPLWMDYGKALSVTSYIAHRLEALLVASCAQPVRGDRDGE